MTNRNVKEISAEFLSDIFTIRFRILCSNLEKFLEDGSVESLHQSRVSARKLEALFDTFGHLSKSGEYKKISNEVSKLIDLLGAGRESDVCLQFANEYLKVVKIRDFSITAFIRYLNRISRLNRNSEDIRLTSEKLINEQSSIFHLFSEIFPSETGQFEKNNLTGYLNYEIQKLYDKIQNYREDVIGGDKKKLHKMRIKAKPLRYMLETYVEFFNPQIERFHKDFKEFVEQAGLVHDYDVLINTLKKFRKEYSKMPPRILNVSGKKQLRIFSAYLSNLRKTEFEHLKVMFESFNEDYRKSLITALT